MGQELSRLRKLILETRSLAHLRTLSLHTMKPCYEPRFEPSFEH